MNPLHSVQDDGTYREDFRGVGLLIERGVLQRDDDFGGHEVMNIHFRLVFCDDMFHVPSLQKIMSRAFMSRAFHVPSLQKFYLFLTTILLEQISFS